ncbi:hypothetical protein [Burkholderia latens]|uniref:AraC family transcriptional regulator n=1 Tax=Burkholderia latens TaxID=488446 RepID=A0A6P2QDD0_9BURK|nr:hypothetical protein [Burkholderia latens]VWC19905.1 AraC family transcriptional regulator [Burkholderia latens]
MHARPSIRLDQLSPGPFHGTLHEIRFDGMQLLRERVNRALLKRGDQCAGSTSFSIPLATAGAGYCGGTPLRDKAWLVSGGTSLLFSLAAQLERAAPWAGRIPPVSAASIDAACVPGADAVWKRMR